MYIPNSDSSFVNDDMNVYGPKAHQRVISRLTSGLGSLYYFQGRIMLEPLPETMLDEGEASPVPDLILYDNQARTTPVIIEVCHSDELRKDIRKVTRLIDEDEYGIREAFVYDYIACQWYRYKKGDGGFTELTSFSDALSLDLNQFL